MPARLFTPTLFYGIRPSAYIGISLFAVAALGRWDDISAITLTFFSAFIGVCAYFLINYIFDRKKELKNNKLRPITTHQIPVRAAYIIAVICCMAMLILSISLSFDTFILSIVLITGFWLYPYINQHFGLLSNIWVSTCVALAFIYGALLYDLTPLIFLAACFTFFVNIGREIFLDVLDTKGDEAVGKPSIPITYGEKGTVVIVSIFFAFASLAVITYLWYYPTTWPWMCAMLLLLWTPFFMKQKEGFGQWALFNVRMSHLLFAVLIVLLFVKPADKQTVLPNITAEYCLDKLEQLQSKKDGFYPAGTFPTQRYWISKKGTEDNNGFNTTVIAYLLRTVNERMPNQRTQEIHGRALRSFETYRNFRDKPSYNFYPKVTRGSFYSDFNVFSIEQFKLPDDLDCTALTQLARGTHPMDQPVRDEMLSYSMRPDRKVVAHFPSKHRLKKVYETWYAYKFQQELDIVVMANVMLFVKDKGYTFKTIDYNTIECLKTAIDEGWYFTNPVAYAQYYNRPAIILYCLSRLVAKDSTGMFNDQRKKLIQDLRIALKHTDQSIEKIMLATSLLRLGEKADLDLSRDQLMHDAQLFSYFSYIVPIIPNFYYRSEAVSWAFMYELFSFNPTIHWK